MHLDVEFLDTRQQALLEDRIQQLLALALGLSADPNARIAAMDELARRLGVVEAV